MIRSLIEAVGSKKLTAALAWLVSFVCLHVLAIVSTKWAGAQLVSPDQVNTFAMWAAGVAVAYIYSQMKLDVATEGKTSTAYLVAAKATAAAVNPQVPPAPAA